MFVKNDRQAVTYQTQAWVDRPGQPSHRRTPARNPLFFFTKKKTKKKEKEIAARQEQNNKGDLASAGRCSLNVNSDGVGCRNQKQKPAAETSEGVRSCGPSSLSSRRGPRSHVPSKHLRESSASVCTDNVQGQLAHFESDTSAIRLAEVIPLVISKSVVARLEIFCCL